MFCFARFGGIGALIWLTACSEVLGQAPPPAPDVPPPPPVIGRDVREEGEAVKKDYLLSVWLDEVGGPGVQQTKYVRVGADGNVTLPAIGAVKAEGVTVGQLETNIANAYKASI